MKHVSSFFTKLFQACKLVPMLPITVLAAIPVALLWNTRPWKHFFWSVNPSIGQWIVIAMVVYTAFDSLKGMIEDIRKGYVGVDVLVIVAILSTIAVREYWAGWAIVLMVYSGEAIEEYAQDKAKGNLTSLMEAAPVIAHVVNLPGIGSNAGHINGSGRQNTGDSGFRPVGEGEIQQIQSSSSHFETVPVDKVRMGDVLVVLPGETVPVDGELLSDSATLDLSNINGEPVPREVFAGARVLSGAVNGSSTLTMRATQLARDSQYQRILELVSSAQSSRATVVRVADLLAVPFTVVAFLIAGFAWICSGVPMRFAQVLVIATPCPLLIAAPVAYIAGTGRLAKSGILIKTQEVLETLGRVSHIFFDKTGTLTRAEPKVAQIVTFGENSEADMLRLAACLEEHYPHSMATAVVEEAKRRGLSHEEYHSQVQYIVAHGISSMVNGEKTLIGSAHFVFEDEGCTIPAGEQEKFDALPTQYSHLYLCLAGQLAAVICIHDPLRAEAKDAIRALHDCGIRKVVMMTGDNRRTAACVAEEVGVDEFHAEVLPEDKADFIRRERAAGHTVIMIGDGVNDSPALSEADAGIAISTGAAIAREISDITITSEDLFQLVTLRRISQSLMDRIHRNYRFIVGFNLGLILLGVAGILPPTTSALLHNASTLGISLKSMTDLLPEPEAAATVPERSGE